MELKTELISYTDQDVACEGFLAYDAALPERRGTVLIVHAWEGRNTFVEDKAVKLAKLGYNGFAVDMYGGARTGATPDERRVLMQPLLEDRRLLTRRISAALETISSNARTHGTHVVAMGYCFGGICVLDLARTGVDIAGAVTFHGGLKAPEFPTQGIQTKVLIFHADNDKFVPMEDYLELRNELNTAGVIWESHVYGARLHSFTNPDETDPSTGMAYDEQATTRSWHNLLAFLKETLG